MPCKCDGSGRENESLTFDCQGQMLGDYNTSRILGYLIPVQEKLAKIILSGNNLTKVPDEIRQFNHLEFVDLKFNPIRYIEAGAFKFPSKGEPCSVESKEITVINCGPFQGNKNSFSYTTFTHLKLNFKVNFNTCLTLTIH